MDSISSCNVSRGHLNAQRDWHREHGEILGYFIGYEPVLLIADPEILKKILLKDFTDFTDRPVVHFYKYSLVSFIGSDCS